MDLASAFVPWPTDWIGPFSLGSSFVAFASFVVAKMKPKRRELKYTKI